MKAMLALAVLLSTSVQASCIFEDLNIHEVNVENKDFKQLNYNTVPFPAYLFSQYKNLESFIAEECEGAVRESLVEYKGDSSQRFRLIYTNEDYCDGGNSYGLVLSDSTLAVVGEIYDSDIYCSNR